MTYLKRIVLDVLKPRYPNALEFTSAVASRSPGCRVNLTVSGVDEKTETVALIIEGGDLRYDAITEEITSMGGSVQSIDEVAVESEPDQGGP